MWVFVLFFFISFKKQLLKLYVLFFTFVYWLIQTCNYVFIIFYFTFVLFDWNINYSKPESVNGAIKGFILIGLVFYVYSQYSEFLLSLNESCFFFWIDIDFELSNRVQRTKKLSNFGDFVPDFVRTRDVLC